MAINQTFNGVVYSIPVQGDLRWGPSLTRYLIALGNGALSPSGGTFTLTADINFGPTFGLLSTYYKSTTADIATVGQIRLAKTDTIDWRNTANTANLPLGINASDQLTFNGSAIISAGTFVSTITGTANQIIASSPSGAVTLSTPQNIATSSSPTFATINLTSTSNQLVLGTTRTTTISADQPALASRSISIPDPGGSSKFILQDIVGSAQQQISTPLLLNGNITFNPSTSGIVGTTTNNSAAAGNVGEYVSNTSGSSGDINGVSTNLTSISLTAGDWDVRGNVQFNPAGGTLVKTLTLGTSTTSATFGAVDATTQKNYTTAGVAFSLAEYAPIPTFRYSLSGTTTIYLVGHSNATASITAVGYLSARRVR
jgi:hypothetical protein